MLCIEPLYLTCYDLFCRYMLTICTQDIERWWSYFIEDYQVDVDDRFYNLPIAVKPNLLML